jgi:hypothetical protein
MSQIFALLLIAAMLLASCITPRSPGESQDNNPPAQNTESTAVATTSVPASPAPETPTPSLKPPDAEQPAAGICTDPPEGEVVTMTIRADMPDPRCAKANPDQRLKLVNDTDATVQVKLGIAEVNIPAGGERMFDMSLAEYLEPGVHFVLVTPPGMGGELWLVDD